MSASLFERAGEVIRNHVAVRSSPSEHAVQRARLVDAACRPPRNKRLYLLLLAPAVVVLALVVVGRFRKPASTPVTFVVGPGNVAGVAGESIGADSNNGVALNFSEGSRVTLNPRARARVANTNASGALVVLETGGARVDVVHRPDAEWKVLAGPYAITVQGTSFQVSWAAVSGTLEVAMFSGAVVVRGPGVESGVHVKDTQRFAISATPAQHSASGPAAAVVGVAPALPSSSPSTTTTLSPTATVEDQPLLAPSSTGPEPTNTASSAAPPAESWSVLAARGEYRAIVADAERRGLDSTLASVSEGDLYALANAGRYAGRGDVAQRALLTLRSRFAGGAQAASAAFLLGRMAEDGGNLGNAIRWYDTYLAEAPSGPLTPEALGRRMVALRRSGQSDAARKAAESYLTHFPAGPYAGVAREIVGP